jgi:predicted membrane chloride channel (bestrophin family)
MVKVLTNQLCSIEVKIENEDVYMVLFMSLPPSFDNLVTSLESMCVKIYYTPSPLRYAFTIKTGWKWNYDVVGV